MIYFITHKPTSNDRPKAKRGFLEALFSTKEKPKEKQATISNKMGANLPFEGQRPHCKMCERPMDLIIQIDDRRIVSKPTQIFQCQNDIGACEDWDADAGGNKVIYAEALQETYSDQEVALEFIESKYSDDELTKEGGKIFYEMRENEFEGTLIGKVHGEPIWIQSEETPSCCDQMMTFVLQLSGENVLNFGDSGEGYLFDCRTCRNGKFLWQCF